METQAAQLLYERRLPLSCTAVLPHLAEGLTVSRNQFCICLGILQLDFLSGPETTPKSLTMIIAVAPLNTTDSLAAQYLEACLQVVAPAKASSDLLWLCSATMSAVPTILSSRARSFPSLDSYLRRGRNTHGKHCRRYMHFCLQHHVGIQGLKSLSSTGMLPSCVLSTQTAIVASL